jgi:4-amino-4-deoxy-L-arabinose transferase-like glycosyltransferase
MLDSWRNRSILLVLACALLRVLLMGKTGLGDAEAYYWAWSREIDWSYFDHPGMIAWVIRLFTELGGNSVFVVRLPALLFFLGSSYLMYRITVRLFREPRAGFWALFVFLLSPIFAVGTLQIVPDDPVVFLWLLFVHLLIRVLDEDRPLLWYAIGVVFGLSLLSKYMAVLLAPSTLLLLAWHPQYRKHLRQPHLYLAGLLSLVVFSPVLIWNLQNNFASFSFHLVERHETSHAFDPTFMLLSLGGQIVYYSPIMWGIMLYLAFSLGKRVLRDRDDTLAIPFWLSVPPLIFFMYITLWTEDSEPHWTSLAYLMLFSAWGWYYVNGSRLFQRLTQASLALAGVTVAVFYTQMLVPFLPVDKPEYDISNYLYGWDEAEQAIRREYDMLPQDKRFILTRHYLLGGQLSYAMQEDAPVYVLSRKTDQYDFFEDNQPPLGGNAVYVADTRFPQSPQRYYRFERCEPPSKLDIYRDGNWARAFYLYRCYDFQGEK